MRVTGIALSSCSRLFYHNDCRGLMSSLSYYDGEMFIGIGPTLLGFLISTARWVHWKQCSSHGLLLMVIHDVSSYLQLFIWERFPPLMSKPINFPSGHRKVTLANGSKGMRALYTHKHRAWRWLNLKQSSNSSLAKVLDQEDSFASTLTRILEGWWSLCFLGGIKGAWAARSRDLHKKIIDFACHMA